MVEVANGRALGPELVGGPDLLEGMEQLGRAGNRGGSRKENCSQKNSIHGVMLGSSGTGGQVGSRPDTNQDTRSEAGWMGPRSSGTGQVSSGGDGGLSINQPREDLPDPVQLADLVTDLGRACRSLNSAKALAGKTRGNTRSQEGRFGSVSHLHRPANSIKYDRLNFLPSPSTSYNATLGWFPQVRWRHVRFGVD